MKQLHDELERWLRAELDEAQEEFRNATPAEQLAASERFQRALDAFTAFILKGELPKRPGPSGAYTYAA